MYKDVKQWYEPTDILREEGFVCEMSREDHGFLCGMIRKKRPHKLLEIGVAEGGTTCVIQKCINMLGLKTEFVSVDLSEDLYYDTNKETGYIYKKLAKENNLDEEHSFLFGKTVAGRLDEIGTGIDFVVLDTAHILPGEILDFLAILPYCTKDAVIVLHDICLNYLKLCTHIEQGEEWVATKILFGMVVAEKYMPYLGANIGAIGLTENTINHLDDVFFALSLTWSYAMPGYMVKEYRAHLEKFYSSNQMQWFNDSVKKNYRMQQSKRIIKNGIRNVKLTEYRFPYEEIDEGAKIILYGAGNVGTEMRRLLSLDKYCELVAWVDKNYIRYDKEQNIESPEVLSYKDYDYILVAVANKQTYLEIKTEILKKISIDEQKIIGPIGKY